MQAWGLLVVGLFLGFFIAGVSIVMSGIALIPALVILGVIGAVILLFAVALR